MCGVAPLPLQPKDFAQKEFLELLLVPYYSELLTTLIVYIFVVKTGIEPVLWAAPTSNRVYFPNLTGITASLSDNSVYHSAISPFKEP